jgi:glycosyltransferase involved in cell wall biosynthesis
VSAQPAMPDVPTPPAPLAAVARRAAATPPRRDALFLVWGPRDYGQRSRAFAGALGIDVHHVVATRRRGPWIAPAKYLAQAVMTGVLLARHRPTVVLVQSPPTVAVLCARLYGIATGARYVVDAHSDAFTSRLWTRPAWLRRWLTRGALATVVTGEHAAAAIRRDGGRAVVVPNIPMPLAVPTVLPDLGPGFHVTVVGSFAPDEPLEAIVEAAARLPDVTFHLTGPSSRAPHRLPAVLPPNLRLTGFLPDDDYLGLLAAGHGVLCLTTRDHTMQNGAAEALAVGTPVVTSRWPLLVSYFDQGTVHVDATANDIARGITELRDRHTELAHGIVALRHQRDADWADTRAWLVTLLGG